MQENNLEKLKTEIVESILDKKGYDIHIIDLREADGAIAQYFILCSADSDRQTRAIADWIQRRTRKNLQEHVWKTDGYESGNWIVLDYVDIIVHVFLPGLRSYYNIEGIWGDFPIEKHEHEKV